MNRKEIKRLLRKAADELTPAEKELIDRWYKNIGNGSDVSPFANEQDEQKIRDDLRHRIEQRRIDLTEHPRRKIQVWWYQVAAAILLITGSVWVYLQYSSSLRDEQMVAATVRHTTLYTEAGKIKKVVLPDGSAVWLNGNSRITLPETFPDTLREVTLEGEAFFEVVSDASRPFLVKTGNLSTLVLGTSFNISAYPNLENMVVNVATGKVAVSNDGQPLSELTMDQQLVFDKSTTSFKREKYNNRYANGWREGKIWLEGTSFNELSVLFANTFGYTLKTELTQLEKVRFTASFRRQDKLPDILNMLCKIPGVNYQIEGRVITMY